MTARGNERKAIYRAERDRKHFLELLPLWCEHFRLRLPAYVLMDNHYHFLLQTTEANLSQAMQWLNVSYTVCGLSGSTRGLGKGFGVVFGSGAWRAQPGGIGPSSRCGQPDDGECGAEEISPAVESGQATAQTGSQSDRGIVLNC